MRLLERDEVTICSDRANHDLLGLQEATVVAAAAPVAAAPADDEDEPQIQKIQTTFSVKLTKFDDTKKINLIKELKNLMEGTNLVQVGIVGIFSLSL